MYGSLTKEELPNDFLGNFSLATEISHLDTFLTANGEVEALLKMRNRK